MAIGATATVSHTTPTDGTLSPAGVAAWTGNGAHTVNVSLTGFGTAAASNTGDFDAAGAAAAAQAAAIAASVGKTDIKEYKSGLTVVWVSASAITINTGSAYVESVGGIVTVSSAQALTGLSLGNSAWGYVYVKSDGTCECNTTATAAPYQGNARSKSGDNTRRFILAIKTDSSGNIVQFQYDPASNLLMFRSLTGSTFRALSGGVAQVKTAISCSVGVPPTSRVGFFRCLNNAVSSPNAFFGSNDDAVDASSVFYVALGPGGNAWLAFPLDASQQAAYINSGPTGATFLDIYGYYNAS